MVKGFRSLILRGNVVDLAIGIVVGAAIGGQPDFSALSFTINGSKFAYGHFLNVLIAFLIIAATVYFFVVVPVNRLMARY